MILTWTELEKRNKTTSKKSDDGVISENCDVIAIFTPIWSNLTPTLKRTPKKPNHIRVNSDI